MTYKHGHFVALSFVNAALEEMVSTNGVNWSTVSGPNGPWTSLTFGGGLFAAVSSSGHIITSTDGVQWKQVRSHSNYDLTSVAYGASKLLFMKEEPSSRNFSAPSMVLSPSRAASVHFMV